MVWTTWSRSHQIKFFIILLVFRRSVQQVCGAHIRVIASGQHSLFRRNVAAVASRWQQYMSDLPARDLNLRHTAPETKALLLDQLF